ncbi:MAG: hypothetical protein LC798_19700 [Chloroflexi bacterium]|nr:hypothetical protein [Chloroflexota bacterium]
MFRPDLDMDGYVRLGTHRRAFDDWLRAEGLIDQDIFYLLIGEGYVEAKCYLRPLRLSVEQDGTAWEWRRFTVSSPPPPEAFWPARNDGEDQT